MNIFIISSDPIECVKALDDKRLVKMVLETAQIICTVLNGRGEVTPYKSTHKNHPVVKWTENNLDWTSNYFRVILDEYTHRYGKIHACNKIIDLIIPNTIITRNIEFVNCARNASKGIDCTDLSTLDAYKTYLNLRWKTDGRLIVDH